jgi:hypothetical protein
VTNFLIANATHSIKILRDEQEKHRTPNITQQILLVISKMLFWINDIETCITKNFNVFTVSLKNIVLFAF